MWEVHGFSPSTPPPPPGRRIPGVIPSQPKKRQSSSSQQQQQFRTLYPPIQPIQRKNDNDDHHDDITTTTTTTTTEKNKKNHHHPRYLPVKNNNNNNDDDADYADTVHTIAYQEYGTPTGIPALFLHGGPGAGCNARHAQFFNPTLYRIVLFDQRGSGRSKTTTTKSTTTTNIHYNNTLLDLVSDCEQLREALNISSWGVVMGGSWGSTLALAYAQEYPTNIKSLLLRGVCLLRPIEVDWLLDGGIVAATTTTTAAATTTTMTTNNDSDIGETSHKNATLWPAWQEFCQAVGVNVHHTMEEDISDTIAVDNHNNNDDDDKTEMLSSTSSSSSSFFLSSSSTTSAATTTTTITTTTTTTPRRRRSRNKRREALHAYYDRLFSDHPAIRLAAARSWMTWEMKVSSYWKTRTNASSTSTSSEQQQESIVLVGQPKPSSSSSSKSNSSDVGGTDDDDDDGETGWKRVWGLRTPWGGRVSSKSIRTKLSSHISSPLQVKQSLWKNLYQRQQDQEEDEEEEHPFQLEIRPIQPIEVNTLVDTTVLPKEYMDYIPAQAMLTCFYSVHDEYAMNHIQLLDRMDRIHHIPCIAVHGGQDHICPIDTAYHVAARYPQMELRIPLEAGHSMYDPAITHELVQATDRIAANIIKSTDNESYEIKP